MSHKPNYRILVIVALLAASFLAFLPQPGKAITRQTDPTALSELIVNKDNMLHPDVLAKWLIDEKPDLAVIDLRSGDDFAKYHIPGAEHIPVKALLEERTTDINGDMVTILASNGDNQASQVWLLLQMMGYENVFVLQGGVNFWVENYVNPRAPGEASPDSEVFKFAFRKAAASHFGGGMVVDSDNTTDAPAKPAFKMPKAKKKKKARSGCS
jgi:rhodanese-related sulfurtransferase